MDIFKLAKEMKKTTVSDRRTLHSMPEIGFELQKTSDFVKNRLTELGIRYANCGKNSVIAYLGCDEAEECILLRADMDALPIKEETGSEYASKNSYMHACGHDAHTAMLLCAASILKKSVFSITGNTKRGIKLLFQAAEETLDGAKNTIENGVLDNPRVTFAAMLHVIVGTEMESGTVIVSSPGISAPAADYFSIKLLGKGAHGSTPEKANDPLAAGCKIVTAIDTVRARELSQSERAVISVGKFISGDAPNVIPNTALIEGSMRSYNENVRSFIRRRIEEIAKIEASIFNVAAEISFPKGCPALENDAEASDFAYRTAVDLFGSNNVYTSKELLEFAEKNGKEVSGAGSEDFAYIAKEVPSVMIGLSAGKSSDGYSYPLHHPKLRIDEEAFPYGASILAEIALRWQNKQNS